MRPHRARSSGFSMVELLVVLSIMAVLAIAAIAYRMDRNSPAVRGALNSIYGALVDARTLARGTGQTVQLVPTGSGRGITLTYSVLNPPTGSHFASGQYVHESDANNARYSIVDPDGSQNPTKDAIESLQTALATTSVNGTAIFSGDMWTTNAFKTTSGVVFRDNGSTNRDAYIAVVGAQNDQAIANGPIGIILLSTSGNIYRYYRSGASSKWVRL